MAKCKTCDGVGYTLYIGNEGQMVKRCNKCHGSGNARPGPSSSTTSLVQFDKYHGSGDALPMPTEKRNDA